jgi:hypothetical protein
MKAATESSSKSKNDFYISTLAPVGHRRGVRFNAADAVMLVVLFLEIAVLTRLILAN